MPLEKTPGVPPPSNQDIINAGYKSWSEEHAQRYEAVGTLPYLPFIFPDQKIDKPSRNISRAIWLPESRYIKAIETAFVKFVGSKALAETMITAFDTTPADASDSESLTDYAISCLEQNVSFTTAAGHIDRLSDVAEFNQALSLAVARREGKKYMPQFKVVINKNMTRERFKFIPAPWLATIGQGVYWGAPSGESSKKHGITETASQEINNRMMQRYLQDKRKYAVALALVPSQSAFVKVNSPDEDYWQMKDASGSAPLLVRSDGGIIPANRYRDSVSLGPVMRIDRAEGKSNKSYKEQVVRNLATELALQAYELTGLRVQYNGQMIGERAVRQSISLENYPE